MGSHWPPHLSRSFSYWFLALAKKNLRNFNKLKTKGRISVF
nr:MAG TPA: hypothetical protein [Caudoviricetes sp.]